MTAGGVSIGMMASNAPLVCDTQLLVRSRPKGTSTVFNLPKYDCYCQYPLFQKYFDFLPIKVQHTCTSGKNLVEELQHVMVYIFLSMYLLFSTTVWKCLINFNLHLFFINLHRRTLFPCRGGVVENLFSFMRWTSWAVLLVISWRKKRSSKVSDIINTKS